MGEIIIKCVHENDKLIYTGFILTTINIYLIARIIKEHDERIKKLEERIKEKG